MDAPRLPRRALLLAGTAAAALLAGLPVRAGEPGAAGAADRTDAHPADPARLAPVAAEYALRVTPPPGQRLAVRRQRWVFLRTADRVALNKRELTVGGDHPAAGEIEEAWLRDPDGRLRFERVFHALRQVADYSPGELATLGIGADWDAVSTLVDARARATLRPQGPARGSVQDLVSADGRQRLRWDSRLALPQTLVRRLSDGRTATLTLQRVAEPEAARRAGWGLDEARSADYRRIDAADFGDMADEPLVKLAEALDLLSGWRQPHRHD